MVKSHTQSSCHPNQLAIRVWCRKTCKWYGVPSAKTTALDVGQMQHIACASRQSSSVLSSPPTPPLSILLQLRLAEAHDCHVPRVCSRLLPDTRLLRHANNRCVLLLTWCPTRSVDLRPCIPSPAPADSCPTTPRTPPAQQYPAHRSAACACACAKRENKGKTIYTYPSSFMPIGFS